MPCENDEPLIPFLVHELTRVGYNGTYSPQGWHILPDSDSPPTPPLELTGGTPREQTDGILDWLAAHGRPVLSRTIAVPGNDVRSVRELTESLYAPYDVREGIVRLAGCRLTYHFIVRVTFLLDAPDQEAHVRHLFFDQTGKPVPEELCQHFDFHRLRTAPREARPDPPIDLPRIEAIANQVACESWGGKWRRLWSSLIGLTWAEGKLEFVIDDALASLAFAGWAAGFRDRWVAPPPYTCPATGGSGFTLARTDDGEVTVAEAIETCEVTGRRLLATRLGTSAVSGRRAALEMLVECPVSKELVLRDELVTCRMCRQAVSPLVVVHGRCRACRTLERVPADEPRIVRITDRWPDWRRDRSWRLGETATVYIAVCRRWWHDWLLVLDKDSLDLQRLARRARLARSWQDLDPPAATDME